MATKRKYSGLKSKLRAWFPVAALTLTMFFSYGSWAQANNPTSDHVFVQLVDGQTIEAVSVDDLYREPKVISRFAEDFVVEGFTWDANTKGRSEQDVVYPKNFYNYSWKVDDTIRPQWLANQYYKYKKSSFPFDKFLDNRLHTEVRSSREPIIKPLEPGQWEVDVLASRYFFDGLKGLNAEVINLRLTLQAKRPLLDRRWGTPNTEGGSTLNRAQLDGLKIIDIVDLSTGVV